MFENAKWISDYKEVISRLTNYKAPAKELRKVFEVNDFNKAIINISGLGAFVLYINGRRVSDDILAPSYSQYEKHTYYESYDVKEYLVQGKNVISVILGDGFYNQTTNDVWQFYASPSRDIAKLILELDIDDKCFLVSDTSFKVRDSLTTIHQTIRTGEIYDSRNKDNWMDKDYDDSSWLNARVVRPTGGVLVKREMPSVKMCDQYKAVDVIKTKNGYILDFGVTISGFVSFKLHAKRDTKLEIDYAEKLKDGDLDKSNIDLYVIKPFSEFQKDVYYFSGDEFESWHTDFTYHGFRYARITGLDEFNKDDFTAHFVHADLKQVGSFDCSEETLKWIYEVDVRSFLSNYFSVPTDCPQREKNGWTGDASLSSSYAVYLYDMKEAYKKFLRDIMDTQLPSGQICCIAPTSGWGYVWGSGPAWDSAMFFLPYEVYKETGDTECFDVMYEAGKRYIEYSKYYDVDGLVCYGLSDWCPPTEVKEDIKLMSNKLSDSCYLYKIVEIMSLIAKLKNENEYSLELDKYSKRIKDAILKEYVHGDIVDNGGIGAMSAVIYFGIVEGEEKDRIAKALVKELERINYKSYVGILGMKALLNALPMTNNNEAAFKVLTNHEYPSFGHLKDMGATSNWECFEQEKWTSLNHHMYNEPLNYMVRNIAGLKNKSIAYKEFLIEPYVFDKAYSSAMTTKETKDGKIVVDWKCENNVFTLNYKKPQSLNGKLSINGKEYPLTKDEDQIVIKL